MLWQALAVSFHLATERHLPIASGGGAMAGGDVDVHATAAGHRKEQPHAPHAASDHKVAQDRVDDDPVPSPSLWLPWIEPVSVPRDMVGVAAGAPPTGPPPVRSQRNPIAARAPPRA